MAADRGNNFTQAGLREREWRLLVGRGSSGSGFYRALG